MKRTVTHAVAALFVLLLAAPLFAVQRNAVDEVIRMSRAGVAEETILDYIDKTDARIVVTGDDVIAMTEANVPKEVVKAMVDAAAAHRGSDYRNRSYTSTRVVVASPYYYDSYYSPYYSYDPFWYRPSISFGIGFGGFRTFHGGFHGGHGGRHH